MMKVSSEGCRFFSSFLWFVAATGKALEKWKILRKFSSKEVCLGVKSKDGKKGEHEETTERKGKLKSSIKLTLHVTKAKNGVSDKRVFGVAFPSLQCFFPGLKQLLAERNVKKRTQK